jgi:hypothetical protein
MCANKAPDSSDYVPVVLVHDDAEAERYVQLLQDHDIPAILGTEEDLLVAMARVPEEDAPSDDDDDDVDIEDDGGLSDGAVVLVPGEHYDEASEFISELEEFDGIPHLVDGEVHEEEEEEIALQPEELDDSLAEDDDSPYAHQPDGGEEFEGLDFDFAGVFGVDEDATDDAEDEPGKADLDDAPDDDELDV